LDVESHRLTLYRLREETPSEFLETHGYERIASSELLPELSIPLLEQCALISDQIEAIDFLSKALVRRRALSSGAGGIRHSGKD
jgi:hypothetical protein